MPKKIIKGYLISIIIFAAAAMIMALLVKFTPVPESYNKIYVLAALSMACFFIGIYGGNLFGKKGLLSGLTFAAVLILAVVTSVSLCFESDPITGILKFIYLIPLFSGGIGGILGANIKN